MAVNFSGANAAAIVSYNVEHRITIYIHTYNIVEQDHREIKRITHFRGRARCITLIGRKH